MYKDHRSQEAKNQQFIAKAKAIWGETYDYSKVHYVNNRTQVTVICPEHGEFYPRPFAHIHASKPTGCPQCKPNGRKNLEYYIELGRKYHGEKYDYSKAVYKTAQTPIEIICPIHGSFWQKPMVHVRKNAPGGCPQCASSRMSTEEFIAKSKEIHGADKYDYAKTQYELTDIPVTITCPVHGDFQIAPHRHISKPYMGCSRCRDHISRHRRYTNVTEFIEAAQVAHDNKYDYSKVPLTYAGSTSIIEIICPVHGSFWQSARSHLRKPNPSGCPKCANINRGKILKVKYEANLNGHSTEQSTLQPTL